MMGFFQSTGKAVTELLSYIGGVTSLFAYSTAEMFARPKPGDRLIRQITTKQIYFTGVQAISTIGVIALTLGMLIIVEMFSIAPKIGQEGMIGKVLVIVIVRELGPLLTAIIVIGRSGTAVATEIANMMVSDEFDALESIGVDPLRYIVYPRIIGMILSLTGLVIFFDAIGLLGGFIAARLIGVTLAFSEYFNNLFSSMSIIDLVVVVFKCVTMGGAIAVISVMQGFKVGRNQMMVPVAATKSVVNSLIAVFIVDGIITLFSYI
jgi:phospholipid/cholesterol/gamma-HCH transport system permease protein